MVGIGVFLNLLVFPDDPGFVGLHPHPAHAVVLFIGLWYGFRASMMAVVISALAYGFLLLELADVPTYLYLLDPPYSTPMVVLMPLGVIVGLLSQRHIDQVAQMREHNLNLQRESALLRGEHEQLRDVNLELAGRVVGAEGTVGQLYEFAKQLNVVSEDKIYEGLLRLLAESLGAERSTIWRVVNSQLVFLVSSEVSPPDGIRPPDVARFAHLFDDRGVLALHDLPEESRHENMPFLLGELKDTHSGQVVALVSVDTLPFDRYSEESIRLFRMIIEWASTSLGNVNAMRPVSSDAAAQVGENEQRFKELHTQMRSSRPELQIQGENLAPGKRSNDRRFPLPQNITNPPLRSSVVAGEIIRPPAEDLAPRPQARNAFLPEHELATIIQETRAPERAKPQRFVESQTQGFNPSRSMILLAEARAPNAGIDPYELRSQARPKHDSNDEEATIARPTLPPSKHRGK